MQYIHFFTLLQYVNQKLQMQLRFLMMSDIMLETCWTINVLWNNKIPLLSCILLVIATSYLNVWWCTDLQTLNKNINCLLFTVNSVILATPLTATCSLITKLPHLFCLSKTSDNFMPSNQLYGVCTLPLHRIFELDF